VEVNKIRELAFSDAFVKCQLLENVRDYGGVTGIAVNLDDEAMWMGGDVAGIVPPWKSTILRDGTITKAKRVAVINVPTANNLGGLVFAKWDWFGNRYAKFPRTTPLYISDYDTVGTAAFDPWVFANQRTDVRDVRSYDVRLNLWWSPAQTDCYMHNEHPFLEIHTQIHGLGRMQKFRERDEATVYEEVQAAPGYTHDPFVRVAADGSYTYPWHRYYSDTDCVWLAIEFHHPQA